MSVGTSIWLGAEEEECTGAPLWPRQSLVASGAMKFVCVYG